MKDNYYDMFQNESPEDIAMLIDVLLDVMDTKQWLPESVSKAKKYYDKLNSDEQRLFRKMCWLKVMTDDEYERKVVMYEEDME